MLGNIQCREAGHILCPSDLKEPRFCFYSVISLHFLSFIFPTPTHNIFVALDFFIFYIYFIDQGITVVPIFSLLYPPSALYPATLQHHPLHQFLSMGCTYKFYDFSVSYASLNLFPSILCLPIMLLIPCPAPSPTILPLLCPQ